MPFTDLVNTALSGGGDVADAEVDVVSLALPAEGDAQPGPADRPPLPGEPVVEGVVKVVLVVVMVVVVGLVLAAGVLAGDGAQVACEDDVNKSLWNMRQASLLCFCFGSKPVSGFHFCFLYRTDTQEACPRLRAFHT